jgi:hypothetical protein
VDVLEFAQTWITNVAGDMVKVYNTAKAGLGTAPDPESEWGKVKVGMTAKFHEHLDVVRGGLGRDHAFFDEFLGTVSFLSGTLKASDNMYGIIQALTDHEWAQHVKQDACASVAVATATDSAAAEGGGGSGAAAVAVATAKAVAMAKVVAAVATVFPDTSHACACDHGK